MLVSRALVFSVIVYSLGYYTRTKEFSISCALPIDMAYELENVKGTKGVKLVHINARSLLQNFDEIEVSFLDGYFDMVVVTESWLHANCSNNLINAMGYNLYRLDRKIIAPSGHVKRGGGIAIYVKDEFNVTTWANLDISNGDIEAMSLSCKLGHNKRLNLTVIYRPPGGNVQSALDKLESIVSSIRLSTSGYTVVTGDLNIDLLTDNACTMKVRQFCNACQVEQVIKCPTRISSRSSTLIDHVYSNSPYLAQSGTIDCNLSDHFPVFCIFKKSRDRIQYKQVTGRSLRHLDEADFRSDILNFDHDTIFSDDDPDLIWDRLYCHIKQVVNVHCPLRTMRITIGRPKYLTDYILSLMKQRDKAFREARRLNTQETWTLARLFRVRVAKELRSARKSYITKQLDLADGDGRMFWRVINSSFFQKTGASITQVFDPHDGSLLDGVDAANAINRFFARISVELSAKFSGAISYDDQMYPAVSCNSVPMLLVRKVTEQIDLIDQNKSSGFPLVPAKLLKLALQTIPDHLLLC